LFAAYKKKNKKKCTMLSFVRQKADQNSGPSQTVRQKGKHSRRTGGETPSANYDAEFIRS